MYARNAPRVRFQTFRTNVERARPEGMEEASVMMVGLNIERIRQGLTILANNMHDKKYSMQQVSD